MNGLDALDRPDRPISVSVILPFYNESRLIRGAIESVRQQTFPAWELLLVDDGSTDESARVADECASEDERVIVLRHRGGENRGIAASRNLGLRHASGRFVAMLDADDRWTLDHLAHDVAILEARPSVGLVCGPSWYRYADGSPDRLHRITEDAPRAYRRGDFLQDLVRKRLTPPPPCAMTFNTAALRAVGGVPPGPSTHEDQRTLAAVSLRYAVYVTDAPTSYYTVRPDSVYGVLKGRPRERRRLNRAFRLWLAGIALRSGRAGVRVLLAQLVQMLTSRRRALASLLLTRLRLRRPH